MARRAEEADGGRGRVSVALDAAPRAYSDAINGQPCRVWEKGEGAPLVFLAGFGGLPRWTDCLDQLAARRRVIAPSLPGFPGTTEIGPLYTHLDWLLATSDLIAGAGLERCDLMGVSLGGALAADVAAVWPGVVDRLILVSPLGLFDEKEPSTDLFAQRPDQLPQLLCNDPKRYLTHIAAPEGADPVEWMVASARAREAAARLLWPLGDTGLASRLHRVTCDTLLVWGAGDRVIPVSYRRRFADGISGNVQVDIAEGSGHLADLDVPAKLAERVAAFLWRRG